MNNRGTQFDPEIADVFLKLLDENRLEINEDYNEIVDKYALPAVEIEIEKFISSVMTTMRTQEDSEGFDFLTGLPMRNRGEKSWLQSLCSRIMDILFSWIWII